MEDDDGDDEGLPVSAAESQEVRAVESEQVGEVPRVVVLHALPSFCVPDAVPASQIQPRAVLDGRAVDDAAGEASVGAYHIGGSEEESHMEHWAHSDAFCELEAELRATRAQLDVMAQELMECRAIAWQAKRLAQQPSADLSSQTTESEANEGASLAESELQETRTPLDEMVMEVMEYRMLAWHVKGECKVKSELEMTMTERVDQSDGELRGLGKQLAKIVVDVPQVAPKGETKGEIRMKSELEVPKTEGAPQSDGELQSLGKYLAQIVEDAPKVEPKNEKYRKSWAEMKGTTVGKIVEHGLPKIL